MAQIGARLFHQDMEVVVLVELEDLRCGRRAKSVALALTEVDDHPHCPPSAEVASEPGLALQ